MNEEHKITRRQAVAGLGATLAVAAVTPVFAAGGKTKSTMEAKVLEDPITKYPKPPFEGQSQPWPRLSQQNEPQTGSRRKKL
jgi:hypothetical protein